MFTCSRSGAVNLLSPKWRLLVWILDNMNYRERSFDEFLPWSHLDMGMGGLSWMEWKRSIDEAYTLHVVAGCKRCGVCKWGTDESICKRIDERPSWNMVLWGQAGLIDFPLLWAIPTVMVVYLKSLWIIKPSVSCRDEAQSVRENRAIVAKYLGVEPNRISCGNQVHGLKAVEITEDLVGAGAFGEDTAIDDCDGIYKIYRMCHYFCSQQTALA